MPRSPLTHAIRGYLRDIVPGKSLHEPAYARKSACEHAIGPTLACTVPFAPIQSTRSPIHCQNDDSLGTMYEDIYFEGPSRQKLPKPNLKMCNPGGSTPHTLPSTSRRALSRCLCAALCVVASIVRPSLHGPRVCLLSTVIGSMARPIGTNCTPSCS